LGQPRDRDLLGHPPLLNQLADKSKVGLRCRGKADFDLLEAEPYQQLEHPAFTVRSHRLDQRLIPVAQVDAAPQRRAVDDLRRPAPVGQIDGRKGAVFVDGHASHRKLLVAGSPSNVAVPLFEIGRIAVGGRQSRRPVLSRRPKRGPAYPGKTAESRRVSYESRRDISISERENSRAGTSDDGGSASLRTPSG